MKKCSICGEIGKVEMERDDGPGYCMSCYLNNLRERYRLNDFDVMAQRFIQGKSEPRQIFKNRMEALEIC